MGKRSKRRRFPGAPVGNPDDNPLGIGLSKKTLIWIGVGVAGLIAYKVWKAKQNQIKPAGVAGADLQTTALPGPEHNASAGQAPSSVPRERMERSSMERQIPDGRL